jgi:hypothetical protein
MRTTYSIQSGVPLIAVEVVMCLQPFLLMGGFLERVQHELAKVSIAMHVIMGVDHFGARCQ